ncbi:nuclear transport factor 2 family protein [Nocardia huaxiensis]|uniref:Nuclear transport factor 2 family protein n=1 Tax=Nocardia huaxiensis TaxID=2755382 RepID=A0A7D6V9V0_9NOCA|nr:nuclear transport factor 2 family protein [Nocardia huaxiensis]QLY30254.1 nuclear transport factor 2 family protein [Nocardia huaxiensis]UFS96124.1 nuclear transport factor 2 family protein [Nocardia huaxiensis]
MAVQPRDVAEQYVKLVATGPTEDIVNLYAADAVVEDPIGSEPRRGHEKIRELYTALEAMERETELHTVKVAGNHVAVSFTMVGKFNGQQMTLDPIDVMEFDDAGKIISMRAYWGPENLRMDQL